MPECARDLETNSQSSRRVLESLSIMLEEVNSGM